MKKEVLAIIPARSGSKGITHKNIRSVAGKPLIAWSIEQALDSKLITRVIVSTDSEDYAAISRKYGAEVPFIRPKEISQDQSADIEVFKHALHWLKENENYQPEYCVHLRPTSPIRAKGQIDDVLKELMNSPEADSVRTIVETPHTPYKMWGIDQDYLLSPILNLDYLKEPYNEPRQKLPKVFLQTANIDAFKSSVITLQDSMTGTKIKGFIEKNFFDIDSLDELEKVITTILINSEKPKNKQTICFDIDGVIATIVPSNEYALAKCNKDTIKLISNLKKLGFKIVLYTARGSATGINWKETTKKQMNEWGVEYDELHFGKPAALYYVDDRLISLNNLQNLVNNLNKK